MRQPFRRDPHDRDILRLAVPALGALVAEPLYILADTAVVGHLGTDPLAGLAVASSILLLGYSLFIFLAYGTTGAVARLIGAGDEREAAHQAVQGMWLALVIGVALSIVGVVLAGPLVAMMGAKGAVRTEALIYLRISLAGVPAMLLVLAGTGYLRGLQNTVTPLVVAVLAAAGNLALELWLIFGLDMGIGASAASTVAATWASAVVYLVWVGRAVGRHRVPLGPHRATMARLAVVGRDLFVRTAALRGTFLLATATAARLGRVDLAAHQIAFQIWSFLALALDAVAIAGQALVGHHLGAEQADRARQAAWRMIEWSIGMGIVFGIGTFLVRDGLAGVFTNDDLVHQLAAFLLIFVAIMQPLNGFVFALDGILIGAGDLEFLAWASIAALVVFVPLTLGVVYYAGSVGWLWCALLVFMATRAVMLGLRYAGDRWLVTGPDRSGEQAATTIAATSSL